MAQPEQLLWESILGRGHLEIMNQDPIESPSRAKRMLLPNGGAGLLVFIVLMCVFGLLIEVVVPFQPVGDPMIDAATAIKGNIACVLLCFIAAYLGLKVARIEKNLLVRVEDVKQDLGEHNSDSEER